MKIPNTFLPHPYTFEEGFKMCCHHVHFHSHVNTKLTKENRAIIKQIVKDRVFDCLSQNTHRGYFHYNENDLTFIGQWYIVGWETTDESNIDEDESEIMKESAHV